MPETNPNAVSDSLVSAISAQLPTVTDEQVAMVLDALNTITTGEPLGTVVTDPDTGRIAVRVAENGIHQWQVTYPDGGTAIERQPTLPGWAYLRRITAEGASGATGATGATGNGAW